MGVKIQHSGFQAIRIVRGYTYDSLQSARKAKFPNVDGFSKVTPGSGNGEGSRYHVMYASPQVPTRSEAEELFKVLDPIVAKIEAAGPIKKQSAIRTRVLRSFQEFKRGKSTNRGGGERAIATSRTSQRSLERWVKYTGIFKKQLPFSRQLHYVEDCRKNEQQLGSDFLVRNRRTDEVVAHVDAKSEFKTTDAQDRAVERAWNSNRPYYLISRTRFLNLTPETDRRANGSIWG